MIVSAALPARLGGALRRAALDWASRRAAWRDVRERPGWALILSTTAVTRAVPADHLRRARRAERADRGADLARVAVHRAAGAVPAPQRADRPPPGRRHAARPGGRDRGRRRRVRARRSRSSSARWRWSARRSSTALSSFVVKGKLRQAGRGPDVVDLRDAGGPGDAAGRDRHDAGPHARPRARSPRSSRSACSAPRWRSSSTTS